MVVYCNLKVSIGDSGTLRIMLRVRSGIMGKVILRFKGGVMCWAMVKVGGDVTPTIVTIYGWLDL